MVSGRASQGAAAAGTEGETNDSDLSAVEIEETVITMVTSAFAGMDLQTTRVDVRKLEGGSVPTLRFTLDDMASTDLERTRVASGKESADDLASIVVGELRRQKGT